MRLDAYDGHIPDELFNQCVGVAYNAKYSSLTKGGSKLFDYKYTCSFTSVVAGEVVFSNDPMRRLWDCVSNLVDMSEYELVRGYINSMKFGSECSIHTDENDYDDGLTILVYLCEEWYPEWFGQTMFFEPGGGSRETHYKESQLIGSVMPKRNRIVAFDKNMPHCVSPMSKNFPGVRFTCAFKLVKTS